MRELLYLFTQKITHFALFVYFREIRLKGMDKVKRGQAVMFVANHQNALLDPLVIAACTPFRAYFLTRSDVFVNPVVNQIFSFLRMLPIYRMRDGRNTLARNEAIFERCTALLQQGNAILLFPEANHNILRRVRPLSKGFTRILFATLEKDPNLTIQLVPVGINYEKANAFPDRVAFCFGDPIDARKLYNREDLQASVLEVKDSVARALQKNTIHIDEKYDYQEVQEYLDQLGIDPLDPCESNKAIKHYPEAINPEHKRPETKEILVLRYVFEIINAPLLLVWRRLFKPRIEEIEFVSTYRFAFAFLSFPVFYALLCSIIWAYLGPVWAGVGLLTHFLLNLIFVKSGRY
jgi:1-acyl-sn-glycerol-3-phosphate acyltransferase